MRAPVLGRPFSPATPMVCSRAFFWYYRAEARGEPGVGYGQGHKSTHRNNSIGPGLCNRGSPRVQRSTGFRHARRHGIRFLQLRFRRIRQIWIDRHRLPDELQHGRHHVRRTYPWRRRQPGAAKHCQHCCMHWYQHCCRGASWNPRKHFVVQAVVMSMRKEAAALTVSGQLRSRRKAEQR